MLIWFMLSGFECVADDDGRMAMEAIGQVTTHLHHISVIWTKVLPVKVYYKAMGKCLSTVKCTIKAWVNVCPL